jgi:hypothetical protein
MEVVIHIVEGTAFDNADPGVAKYIADFDREQGLDPALQAHRSYRVRQTARGYEMLTCTLNVSAAGPLVEIVRSLPRS